jgi:hypothetical protein
MKRSEWKADHAVCAPADPEWRRWQQGNCGIYAHALRRTDTALRFGVLGETLGTGWWPLHYFAHDEQFAYDSAGRHRLPYRGLDGSFDVMVLDQAPEDWGVPDEEAAASEREVEIGRAEAHVRLWEILRDRRD